MRSKIFSSFRSPCMTSYLTSIDIFSLSRTVFEIFDFKVFRVWPWLLIIPGIERIDTTKLLGVILTSNLSWTPHINNILNICCQRFYLLNRLKHMSLCNTGLNLMFRSLVVSRLIYALPAFSGLVQQADRDRINALLRKGKRWGLTQEDLGLWPPDYNCWQ